MKVGFIGLGTMGFHMATNLQKAGHDMVVSDIRPDAGSALLAKGAVWADTPKQVGEQSDVVFTSLPGPPEVTSVATGPDGLLSGMAAGKVYFALCFFSFLVVCWIQAQFAERGEHMLDAPLSGGTTGAESGKHQHRDGGDQRVYKL